MRMKGDLLMIKNAKWIAAPVQSDVAFSFQKQFTVQKPIKKATLSASAVGTYVAKINGNRVTDAVLMPGWTSYKHRTQYQTYDVTALLGASNRIEIGVGNGWAVGYIGWSKQRGYYSDRTAAVASLDILYADGTKESILTDADWEVFSTEVTYTQVKIYIKSAGNRKRVKRTA